MECIKSYLSFKNFVQLFRVLCFIATVSIVIYWIFTFAKDEDLSKIEIRPFKSKDDLAQLEFTICFENPFREEILKKFDANLSSTEYTLYLKGGIPDKQTYKNILFDEVTLNLYDHLAYIRVWKINGEFSICKNLTHCPYVEVKNNANAFTYGSALYFFKCYGIQSSHLVANEIIEIEIAFKPTLSLYSTSDRWIETSLAYVGLCGAYVFPNYPQQVFRPSRWQPILKNLDKQRKLEFSVTDIEMIKRRNKRNDPCLLNFTNFDNYIMGKHVKNQDAHHLILGPTLRTLSVMNKINLKRHYLIGFHIKIIPLHVQKYQVC